MNSSNIYMNNFNNFSKNTILTNPIFNNSNSKQVSTNNKLQNSNSVNLSNNLNDKSSSFQNYDQQFTKDNLSSIVKNK